MTIKRKTGGPQCIYESVNWPANFKRLDHPNIDYQKT